MQEAWIWHAVAALLYIAISFGHIYLGTIGVEGAYQAMRTGYVDETWAKEHHEYLVQRDEVRQARGRRGRRGARRRAAHERRNHENAFLLVLAAGLLIGAIAASHAKLPPPPAKSDAEKAAEAEKAAAAKAKDAERARQGAGQGGRQLQEEQGHLHGAVRGTFQAGEEVSSSGPRRRRPLKPVIRFRRRSRAARRLPEHGPSDAAGEGHREPRADQGQHTCAARSTSSRAATRCASAANVTGLRPNGEFGFHIHEAGDCSSGDGMSAKGHFNPVRQAARAAQQRRAPRRRHAEPQVRRQTATPTSTSSSTSSPWRPARRASSAAA